MKWAVERDLTWVTLSKEFYASGDSPTADELARAMKTPVDTLLGHLEALSEAGKVKIGPPRRCAVTRQLAAVWMKSERGGQ